MTMSKLLFNHTVASLSEVGDRQDPNSFTLQWTGSKAQTPVSQYGSAHQLDNTCQHGPNTDAGGRRVAGLTAEVSEYTPYACVASCHTLTHWH